MDCRREKIYFRLYRKISDQKELCRNFQEFNKVWTGSTLEILRVKIKIKKLKFEIWTKKRKFFSWKFKN